MKKRCVLRKTLAVSILTLFLVLQSAAVFAAGPEPPEPPSLKDKYNNHFLVGSMIGDSGDFDIYEEKGRETIEKHYSIVTVNQFYWSKVHPEEGVYNFDPGDRHLDSVSDLNKKVRGHPLLFGSIDPEWIFMDGDQEISRDKLIQRMKDHIQTVMTRYKGEIDYWDVVNEPTADPFFSLGMEASSFFDTYKKVPWYEIIGEEYVELAFQFAHEADPNAKLFINENNIIGPISEMKQHNFIKIVKNLLDRGVPLHGVGIQGHFAMDYPPTGSICDTVKIFTDMGLEVHITELDISTYSIARWVTPGLVPKHCSYNFMVESLQRTRYTQLFKELRSCSGDISAVIFWGILDENSWLNRHPDVRDDWPLLFHGNYEPKEVFWDVVDF